MLSDTIDLFTPFLDISYFLDYYLVGSFTGGYIDLDILPFASFTYYLVIFGLSSFFFYSGYFGLTSVFSALPGFLESVYIVIYFSYLPLSQLPTLELVSFII